MNILITGAAGFIGFHTTQKFCKLGHQVVGIDTLNDYYDPFLKQDRLNQLRDHDNFEFHPVSITDKDSLDDLFEKNNFNVVINLAAQAGVRFSIDKPYKYLDANLTGFLNVLEGCRNFKVKHLIYASSSSVYGDSNEIPFTEDQRTDYPKSLYAATKKANESMAYAYSSLYEFSVTGLRFFTVYGPWGRPDMAYYKFVDAIYHGRTIQVYNEGKSKRDFTYVDDIVNGIVKVLEHKLKIENGMTSEIFNIGGHHPVEVNLMIEIIENLLGKKAIKELLPMQPGDVKNTYASIDKLVNHTGIVPSTTIEEGMKKFVNWYQQYHS